MRIMFMGTPDFAVGCLEALIVAGHDVAAAVSQPDRPKGRGHKLVVTPVHACAAVHQVPIYQPVTLRDKAFLPVLEAVEPEVIVVVAYGKILPEYILQFPKYGCINVHASLLPKYRGAAPIQWSILNGETQTGITTMYMEKGLDTGDMLMKESIEIGPDETAQSLHDRLMTLGAVVLLKTLEGLRAGTLLPEKQKDSDSSYAARIDKELARIDWTKHGSEIKNLVRAMNAYPLAHTTYQGKMMKIGRVHTSDIAVTARPGTILACQKGEGIQVACGDGSVFIDEVQFEGKKMMSADAYLAGHRLETGVVLGDAQV